MKVQILVNHYKEGESVVKRFLSSLQKQVDAEFEVLIYGDGGLELNKDLFSEYTFPITYKYCEHLGMCAIRSKLMHDATAEYIIWCDIDDEFYKKDGLYSLIKEAEETHADIIASPYTEEGFIDGKYKYRVLKDDTIRHHGKLFRKAFLEENNIDYFTHTETAGDLTFLWLAFALSNKTIWIKNNFYIWKYNKASVTREEDFSGVRDFADVCDCYILLAQDLIKRGRLDLFKNLITTTTATIYLTSTSFRWQAAPKEFRDKSNKSITAYLKSFYPFYQTIDETYKRSKYDLMLQYMQDKTSGDYENIHQWAEAYLNEKYEPEILIIGYNELSKKLEEIFKHEFPSIYAPNKYISTKGNYKYKIAFICEEEDIQEKIQYNDAEVYVLISPNDVQINNKRIVFSPSYCWENNSDFTILGGNKKDCQYVIQILNKTYGDSHKYRITDYKTAKMAGCMVDSYLSQKIVFCNKFYNIAEQSGINYEELRELFVLDPRVEPAHTFVYDEHPYWDSHCLNKDVLAIANCFDASLLKSVITFNQSQKTKK